MPGYSNRDAYLESFITGSASAPQATSANAAPRKRLRLLRLTNDVEFHKRCGPKPIAHPAAGCFATPRHQYPAGPRCVIAWIKGLPAATQIGFKPRTEIHRCIGRRQPDITDITTAIARRNIHRAT